MAGTEIVIILFTLLLGGLIGWGTKALLKGSISNKLAIITGSICFWLGAILSGFLGYMIYKDDLKMASELSKIGFRTNSAAADYMTNVGIITGIGAILTPIIVVAIMCLARNGNNTNQN